MITVLKTTRVGTEKYVYLNRANEKAKTGKRVNFNLYLRIQPAKRSRWYDTTWKVIRGVCGVCLDCVTYLCIPCFKDFSFVPEYEIVYSQHWYA